LTSCFVEIKEKININEDGSGNVQYEFTYPKMFLNQKIISELNELEKRGLKIKKGEIGNMYNFVIEGNFKSVSSLNDKYRHFTFFSKKKGLLTKEYFFEVEFIRSFYEVPLIFYEFSIKMPGKIEETNGLKISPSEVKWTFSELKKGTKLYAKSSGLAISDFIANLIGLIIITLVLIKIAMILKREIKTKK
jgi:hypothetical protein